MIGTAVDTNVVAEILLDGPAARAAADALASALEGGPVVASGIVYAELCAAAPAPDAMDALLEGMSVEVDFDLPPAAIQAAAAAGGRTWPAERPPAMSTTGPGAGS